MEDDACVASFNYALLTEVVSSGQLGAETSSVEVLGGAALQRRIKGGDPARL